MDHKTNKKVEKFRSKDCLQAYAKFIELNNELLLNTRFQEVNAQAAYKILKKFDKKTSLSSKKFYSDIVLVDNFFVESLAKESFVKLTSDLVTIVPQIDDYLCPICSGIAVKPVRLECGHVFCLRCMIILQRKMEDRCPLCRRQVLMKADSGNLDLKLLAYLKKYFPLEAKLKQKDNEDLLAKEFYDKIAADSRCTIA